MTAAFGIEREYPDEANGITRVSCITRAEWEEGLALILYSPEKKC